MQSLFTLYIGGQFDRDGKPLDGGFVTSTLREFMEDASREFGGVTLLMGWGGYIDARGEYVQEKSAKLEIVAEAAARWKVRDGANKLRRRLNVEAILLTETSLAESLILSGAAP